MLLMGVKEENGWLCSQWNLTELVFDSFTMDIDDMSIAVYFSNKSFMFGHFIDARWDADWNFRCYWID